MKIRVIISIIAITIMFGSAVYASWYDSAVNTVISNGIMVGDEGGFRPTDYITRGEVAQVVTNLINSKFNQEGYILSTITNVMPANVRVISGNMGGGGVFIDKDKIITVAHVIVDSNDVNIYMVNGQSFKATVLKKDDLSDLALLQISPVEITPIKFATGIKQGETILTIGNPLSLNFSVTKGVISKTSRIYNLHQYIQIDAPVNHGNSGGAVINVNGELVGLVDLKLTDNNAEGLGMAIPYSVIQRFIK